MPKIVRITPIESIQPGPASAILEDGTITNPIPYLAADIEFDGGVVVQVQRPLTPAAIQAAYKAAADQSSLGLDGIKPGDIIP